MWDRFAAKVITNVRVRTYSLSAYVIQGFKNKPGHYGMLILDASSTVSRAVICDVHIKNEVHKSHKKLPI